MASNAASCRSYCGTETSCCLDPSFASFDFASSSSSTSGAFSSASVGLSASDFSPIFEGSTGAATPSSASASSSSLEHSSTPLDRSFSSPDLISSIFEESLAINMHGFDETDGLSQDLDLKGKPCLDDAYPAHVSFQAECGGNDDTLLSSEISDLFLGSSFLHDFSDADEIAAWSNPLISSNPEEPQKVPSSTSDEQESASQMFAEWLRSNSHWLSMSDLRKIKLKTSTVENATKRLGGGKKGLMLFLKFVLMWVQNSKQNAVADESAACLSSEGLPTTPPSALMAAAVVNDKQESSGDAFVAAVTPNVLIDAKAQTHPSFPGSESSSTSALNTNWTGSGAQAAQTVAAQSSFPDSELRCYPSMTGGGAYDLQSTSFYPPNSPWLYHASHFMPGVSPPTVSSILPSPSPSSKAHIGGAHNANVGCITTQTQHRQSAGSNLAATCRAARKKRMDMQRWSVRHNRKWAAANQQCHVSAAEMSSGYNNLNAESRSQSRGCGRQNFCISPQIHPPMLRSTDLVDHEQSKRRGRHLKLLFHKQLKQSDVGILGRIVLPKAAETCLPPLEQRDGVTLVVEDMNTSEVWNMQYRFWPNNNSRMYLLENTSDFIKLNNLKDGDQMLMYHLSSKRYVIRGIKAKGTQSAAPLGSGTEIHTGDKRTRSFLEEEGETNSSSATIEDELTLEESCMDLSFVDLIEQSLENVQ